MTWRTGETRALAWVDTTLATKDGRRRPVAEGAEGPGPLRVSAPPGPGPPRPAVRGERPSRRSQQITFESGRGAVGLANRGLNHWGLNFVAAKPYEGYVWAKAAATIPLVAALESGDGSKIYAEQTLSVTAGDWQRIDFSIAPNSTDHDGRFVLELKQPGTVTLGYVFLQPGSWGRFKDLPVRRDVVEGLLNQGITVLRYGGSMVNSPDYRWKKMIGPRDRRPPYAGTWYPYSSNGWGIIDFLNLCEAAGIVGVPDLNVNETPPTWPTSSNTSTAPPDSPWGRKRAADGHPAPYHLTYLELGNEERVDDSYAAKFKALAKAIWAKDPDIILVVGDFVYKHKITDPDHITGADSRITNLDGQRQILDLARRHHREVWFDVHVWSERLNPSDDLQALPTYMDAIDRLANGATHKVVVFELNANSHGQLRTWPTRCRSTPSAATTACPSSPPPTACSPTGRTTTAGTRDSCSSTPANLAATARLHHADAGAQQSPRAGAL